MGSFFSAFGQGSNVTSSRDCSYYPISVSYTSWDLGKLPNVSGLLFSLLSEEGHVTAGFTDLLWGLNDLINIIPSKNIFAF